jgi:phosphatidylserine/phosphatidylglycerophosphate/cardiolipin synthase-like enzyme
MPQTQISEAATMELAAQSLASSGRVAAAYAEGLRPFLHLKSCAIDGQALRTGAANFSTSGERQQDNDLVVIRDLRGPRNSKLTSSGCGRRRRGPYRPLPRHRLVKSRARASSTIGLPRRSC